MSLINITVNLGFLAAVGVVYACESALGDERFKAWGWRVPFFVALVPGVVAIAGRCRLPESEMFEQRRGASAATNEGDNAELAEEDRAPPSSMQILTATVRSQWPSMLIGSGGVVAFAVLQYGAFVWSQSFLAHHGMLANDRLYVGLVSRGLMTVLGVFVGWLADVMGVGWVMLFGGVCTTLLGLPLWAAVQSHPTDLTVVLLSIGIGLAALGALVGTSAFLFVVELFPTEVRNTAVGISYNVGFAVFGGLAPMMAEATSQWALGPGLLYSAAGATTALAVCVGLWLQRRQVLRLAHVRREPYFVTCSGASQQTDKTDQSCA